MSTARPEGRFGVVHVLVISGNLPRQELRYQEDGQKEGEDTNRTRYKLTRVCAISTTLHPLNLPNHIYPLNYLPSLSFRRS